MAEFSRDDMNSLKGMFGSRGASNTGLGLGIAGTTLGLLNGGLGNVGGIFGNNNAAKADEKIDFLQSELMRERCERYTDQKICDLKSLMYDKFEGVNASINTQAVWNATQTSTLACLTNQVNQITALLTYGIASDKVISSSSSGSAGA